nr:MAG: hypothetical protein [Bacteriophage sp.]
MAVFTQYLIINIALFVIIAYLVKDIKEILKDDNETFED